MIIGQLQIIDGKPVKLRDGRVSPEALERRHKHQSEVMKIGISPDVINEIVEEFYARVSAHEVLAPLFVDPIGDRWSEHLQKMKSFWMSVALNAGTYSGKPVLAHQALKSVEPWHFDLWLDLFRETVRDITSSEAATDYFMARADRIAMTLNTAMFHNAVPQGKNT